MSEPKAKRTHAKRSCDLCKTRKTRCELPDLEVPSSLNPLPIEKSCHRCKVLALPCVVDDAGKKQGMKRPRLVVTTEVEASPAGGIEGVAGDPLESSSSGAHGERDAKDASPPPRTRTNDGLEQQTSSGAGKSRETKRGEERGRNEVNHTLEVTYGIHPALEFPRQTPTSATVEPALYSSDPFLKSPPPLNGDGAPITPDNVLKLHGRPLELVCTMLRTAYTGSKLKGGRPGFVYQLPDWGRMLSPNMRVDMEIGFAQLRTFHPYLDPLPTLLAKLGHSHSTQDQLLLSTVIYLCSLPLPPSPPISKLRSTLRPLVTYLRDTVLLQLPQSFHTLQALEILGLHAPLGCVPLQIADPRTLGVAKGQVAALRSVTQSLGFHVLFGAFVRAKDDRHWYHSDTALFLSIAALEAGMVLEDESPRAPESLKDARYMSSRYMEESREYLWRSGLEQFTPAELLGRLGVCDRLARLGEVLDSIERLKGILETAATDYSLNPVDAIVEEFSYFAQRMDRCDSRHDTLLSLITPYSNNLECGYMTHRSIRRRYEHTKILSIGLRYLIATNYLPGTPMALPNLPDIPVHQRVSYAINRASNPADILPIIMANSVSTMTVWQYGSHRGDIFHQILTAFSELERVFIPQTAAPDAGGKEADAPMYSSALVPLHECVVFTVEAAKVLMEMRAGTILMHQKTGKLSDATRSPPWLPALKGACHTLRKISLLSPSDQKDEQINRDGKGGSEGETIANGCSNILGSMVRVAEEWGRSVVGSTPTMDDAPPGVRRQSSSRTQERARHSAYPADHSHRSSGYGIHGGIDADPVLPGSTTLLNYRRDQHYRSPSDTNRTSGTSHDHAYQGRDAGSGSASSQYQQLPEYPHSDQYYLANSGYRDHAHHHSPNRSQRDRLEAIPLSHGHSHSHSHPHSHSQSRSQERHVLPGDVYPAADTRTHGYDRHGYPHNGSSGSMSTAPHHQLASRRPDQLAPLASPHISQPTGGDYAHGYRHGNESYDAAVTSSNVEPSSSSAHGHSHSHSQSHPHAHSQGHSLSVPHASSAPGAAAGGGFPEPYGSQIPLMDHQGHNGQHPDGQSYDSSPYGSHASYGPPGHAHAQGQAIPQGMNVGTDDGLPYPHSQLPAQPQQQGYVEQAIPPPTALDVLLSQMFNYGAPMQV